jgi:hypothetical protein
MAAVLWVVSSVWAGMILARFHRSLLPPSSGRWAPITEAARCVLMMEAVRTYETSVNWYRSTRRYNPEGSHLRTHRRENLKSCVVYLTTLPAAHRTQRRTVRRINWNGHETKQSWSNLKHHKAFAWRDWGKPFSGSRSEPGTSGIRGISARFKVRYQSFRFDRNEKGVGGRSFGR